MWHKSSDGHAISVTWGPEAAKMTEAERQAYVDGLVAMSRKNRDEHDRAALALDGLPYVAVPIDQLADIYERFLRLTKMGQAAIEEWGAMPKELADLRHAIFGEADFGAVYAGQWLPKDVREQTREKAKTPKPETEDAELAE